MEKQISDLFTSHLPTLPPETSEAFARGMLEYVAEFRVRRDAAMMMDYEADAEYRNTQITVMRVNMGEFWIYAPHFRKCMALALQTLFKTKMSMLSSSQASMEQVCVFVDEKKFRWIMVVEEDALNAGINRVYMYLPRGNTPIVELVKDAKLYTDEAQAMKPVLLMTTDITHWTGDT